MKFFTNILFSFFVFASILDAQVENAIKSKDFVSETKFHIDFLNFKAENDHRTRLDAFVQVPYSVIQFVKEADGFTGRYSVTISVFDETKDKLIVEKNWYEKIESKKFEETNSKDNFNLSLRSFQLEPATYIIRSSVEDQDSRKEYTYENVVNVRNFSKLPAVSDIMLIAKESIVDGNKKILPNVSKNVTSQKEGMPIFFEIYSDSSVNVKLEYIIKDKNNIVFDSVEAKNVNAGRTQFFPRIQATDLSLGDYVLTVNLENLKGNILTVSSKQFVSRWIGLPSNVKDLDVAIAQLVYIASSKEISEMEDAKTKDEKIKLYSEFWKKKDPSPATEENEIRNEYFRRIAYTNENFGHYVDGWKTDRGMVFIILGPPNNVDRHPFEYDSKPYEVWQYYDLNKDFVFIDETGFGDYRLITPLYGDFYRYR
ncbi:MAG: GWxTD domain-containing protein [Ignavibacteriaceae bacterium]